MSHAVFVRNFISMWTKDHLCTMNRILEDGVGEPVSFGQGLRRKPGPKMAVTRTALTFTRTAKLSDGFGQQAKRKHVFSFCFFVPLTRFPTKHSDKWVTTFRHLRTRDTYLQLGPRWCLMKFDNDDENDDPEDEHPHTYNHPLAPHCTTVTRTRWPQAPRATYNRVNPNSWSFAKTTGTRKWTNLSFKPTKLILLRFISITIF